MITCLILVIVMILFRVPSDYIRNMSSDTSLILFSLCVISDIHILMWVFSDKRK